MAIPGEGKVARAGRRRGRHQPFPRIPAALAVTLAERLAQRIAARGPMPFDEWMEACLYDAQEGYYMRPGRKTGRGDDADFVTSPTLHPFFGAAIAMEAAAAWQRLGSPPQFTIVEFGGGEGDLARSALAWLDRERQDLARKVTWIHIEKSPEHRAKQTRADHRITWLERIPAAPALPVAFVVANELLDALPFKWLQRDEDGWLEVHVGVEDGEFDEVLLPSDLDPPANVDPGVRIAFHQGARAWLQDVGNALARAEALVIDYGERYLWGEDRPDGSVRTYRRHEDAGSPLQSPGDLDITASMDFAELAQWAREAGWREAWYGTQEEFLLGHGVLEVLNAIPRNTEAGVASYLRLRQLLLPSGLGAFKVQRLIRPA